jgi:hypothetical protein
MLAVQQMLLRTSTVDMSCSKLRLTAKQCKPAHSCPTSRLQMLLQNNTYRGAAHYLKSNTLQLQQVLGRVGG